LIAIDTNVLVRLLTADSPAQYKVSLDIFSSADVYIPESVILEAEWVLRAAYGLKPDTVSGAFRQVLGLPNVFIDDPQRIDQVLSWHEQGLDFTDGFHLSVSFPCEALMTFDALFVKRGKNLSPCRVEKAKKP